MTEEKKYQDVKENRLIPLTMLFPHERNYRQHPEAQVKQIVASLERFGQVRSIVVQECANGSYTIVAGHGVTSAAEHLKYRELRADILPSWWTPEQVAGYLVADNNLSMEALDDDALLAGLLQEQKDAGFDLASMGSDDEALRQMLESMGDEYLGDGGGSDEGEDEYDEPEEEQTRVRLGDVWQLGKHKIACLDSCDPETYKKLFLQTKPDMVFADPPYGIEIVDDKGWVGGGEVYRIPFGGVKNRPAHNAPPKPIKESKYSPVIGDNSIATAIVSYRFCAEYFPSVIQIWWGANYYAHMLPPSSCWIIWDKEINGNFADAELAWCSDKSAVRIFKHMWNGMVKASEHGQKRVHPTQKPVKLAEWCYEKYGKEGDVIYDPFLGSGMSLIAAENTNRSVIGCELSPEYIDVIITRWEKHTGQTATLLERIEEVAHV